MIWFILGAAFGTVVGLVIASLACSNTRGDQR